MQGNIARGYWFVLFKKLHLQKLIIMKKLWAVFILGIFGFYQTGFSQCPGCTINTNCTITPLQPGLCPSTLPDGTAMQPYDENITIFLPHNFTDQGSGMNVDLTKVEIQNITGMPIGMSFQTNAAPANIFYPTSNPPTSEYGCAKICGTPLIAGSYVITVFVKVDVDVISLGGISQTQNSSFDLPITILPALASNNGFTIGNPIGCEPHSTSFLPVHHSNGNPNYHYTWNFGNGNMSTLEVPPVQNYNTLGDYVVSLQTQIDTLPYYFSGLTVNAAPDCNDSPFGSPDYYFILKLGSSTVYTASYIENTNAPVTFSVPATALSNSTYSILVYDSDGGLAGDDDFCGTFNIAGNTAGTFTLNSGTTSITYTVTHPVLSYNDVDTISVYQSPQITAFTLFPNDTICEGDSATLSVVAMDADYYQWFADTNAINNAFLADYTTSASGLYSVEVTNYHGCRVNSSVQKITVAQKPIKPNVWITGNTLNTNASGVYLQWYYEGNLISGAVSQSYPFSQTGNYFVIGTNTLGCSTSSDTIYATYQSGITENETFSFTISPNPATDKVFIHGTCDCNEILNISIKDALGNMVKSVSYKPVNALLNINLDVSNLSKGVYFIELKATNSAFVRKLIVQ
jgi:hypothetical protein